MEISPKTSEDSCSALTKNLEMARLPNGSLIYIGIPFTTAKPSHHRNNDANSLISSVLRTYDPKLTKPNIIQYQDLKKTILSKLIMLICVKFKNLEAIPSIKYNCLEN